MKLNWFSPLAPARTDIAHYTSRVLEALASRAEVTLWTTQTHWDEKLNSYAKVRSYRLAKIPWAELNRGDMAIYHVGNEPKFHRSIWQISQRHPGIVVLHDFCLQPLFAGIYLAEWRDLDAYLTQMEFYYGKIGRQDAQEFYRRAIEGEAALSIDKMAERYPLTMLALEHALGVVAHSRQVYERLRPELRCPLVYSGLPFPIQRKKGNARSKRGVPSPSPYRLIVFGYLGKNRRLDSLFESLAGLTEKEKFHLDVFGQVADERSVRRTIQALGLKELVTLHGYVPDAKLDAALEVAHLAINLRFPTMGEASGTQLRIWAHGLPSLVTETGWYETLPGDAVCFVRPFDEIADIQKHLRAFLAHPERFAQMGEMGREILEKNHTPEQYARVITNLAERARSYRPVAAIQAATMRSSIEMSAWLVSNENERDRLELIRKKHSLIYGRTESNNRFLRAILRRAFRISSWRRRLRGAYRER